MLDHPLTKAWSHLFLPDATPCSLLPSSMWVCNAQCMQRAAVRDLRSRSGSLLRARYETALRARLARARSPAYSGGGPAPPLSPPSKKLGKIDEHRRPPTPLKLATYVEIDRPSKA
eukprot:scaffold4535_cov138-Isochrysis_galbana.AAC.5